MSHVLPVELFSVGISATEDKYVLNFIVIVSESVRLSFPIKS